MNKKLIVISTLLLAQYILPVSAYAADSAVINITANIVASPCTVSTPSVNVDLGDIQADTLDALGKTSPWSPTYAIKLTNCPVSTTSVVATFSGTPANNGDPNGYISGLNAVSVQLGDTATTPNYLSNGKTLITPVTGNAADVNFKARLYAGGTVMPGSVTSTVNVSFTYK